MFVLKIEVHRVLKLRTWSYWKYSSENHD